jgi:hypothetical protein
MIGKIPFFDRKIDLTLGFPIILGNFSYQNERIKEGMELTYRKAKSWKQAWNTWAATFRRSKKAPG